MKPLLLTALALSIAACSQPSEQPAVNNTEASEVNAGAPAPVPSLEGEWVVEQGNAKALD